MVSRLQRCQRARVLKVVRIRTSKMNELFVLTSRKVTADGSEVEW